MKQLNISKLFDNKTFRKIISIVGAVMIWASVTLALKTDSQKTISNIPIDFSVEGTAVAALGLSPFDRSDEYVTVKISGNRGSINSVSKDDIAVTLSTGRVTSSGKHTVNVSVSLRGQIGNATIADYSPKSIQVTFDKAASKTLQVITDISNVTANKDFLLDKGYPSVQEITVSGPESIVNTIQSCSATVPTKRKDLKQSITVAAVPIVLYDANGNIVSNPNLTLDKETVDISVPVLKIKELPIAAHFINKPANFDDTSFAYTLSATKIQVAGPAETIDTISQIDIRYIDLKSVKPGDTVTLNVELPSGFLNISSLDTIDVTVPSNNMQEKSFSVNQFKLLSAPEGRNVTIVTQRLNNVVLVGDRGIIKNVTSQDIVAELDLSSVSTSGTFTIPATITIPNQQGVFWAYGNYEVVIRIN